MEPSDNFSDCESGTFGDVPLIEKSYIGIGGMVKPVTYAIESGLAIFEGDIVLGTKEQMDHNRIMVENPTKVKTLGIAISDLAFRWPDGVIIYQIAPALPNPQRVTDAVNHIVKYTNLNFRIKTTEENYVNITRGDSCLSAVGMTGGRQNLTLGDNCSMGSCIHELCHVAGLWHEQSRADRNTYVQINTSFVQPSYLYNFDQHINDGIDLGAYDYNSIMHYGANYFSLGPIGGVNLPTIVPIPDPDVPIGQRNNLSPGDIAALNTMYPRNIVGDPFTIQVPDGSVYTIFQGTFSSIFALVSGGNSRFLNFSALAPTAPLMMSIVRAAWYNGQLHIIYRGINNSIADITWDGTTASYTNLSATPGAGVPASSASDPGIAVVGTSPSSQFLQVAYRDENYQIALLSYDSTAWTYKNLNTLVPAAPGMWGAPSMVYNGKFYIVYYDLNATTSCIFTSDLINYEYVNLTSSAPGALRIGSIPSATSSGGNIYVTYRESNNYVGLISQNGPNWTYQNLNSVSGAPLTSGDPVALDIEGTLFVFYKGADKTISTVIGKDFYLNLTGITGAPLPNGFIIFGNPSALAFGSGNIPYVTYLDVNNQISILTRINSQTEAWATGLL